METPIIILLLLLGTGVLQICLGLLIFFINKTRLEGTWYFIHLLSLGLWTLGMFFYYWLPLDSIEEIVWWVRFLYCFGVYSAISFFLFTLSFVRQKTTFFYMFSIFIWIIILGYILFESEFIIAGMEVQGNNRRVLHGNLYFLFFITLFSFYLSGFYVLAKKYFSTKISILRKQIKYILLASLPVVGMASVFNMILPAFWGNFTYAWLSPLFLSLEAIVIYYSIYRYRFLDIKLTILRGMKILLSFFASIFIAGFILVHIKPLFDFEIPTFYLLLIDGTLTVAFYFIFIWFFDSNIFGDLFGAKSAKVFRQTISYFKSSHFIYESVSSLENNLRELFCKKLNIKSLKLIILTKEQKKKYQSVLNYYEKYNDVLVKEEIPYIEMKNQVNLGISNEIQQEGEVFIPLANPIKGGIAILILGKKQREIYLARELKTLRNFGHFLSLVLTGILYNKDLKKEVSAKTEALVEKNKKLKVLDEAKTNFLSMASHELRTPMTIVKEYANILLAGRFGDLNRKQIECAEYIKQNSKDLLNLVNDMLDLTKIEADEMSFNYEKVNLKKRMITCFAGFQVEAKRQGINFFYKINKTLPRHVIVDYQKIYLILNNIIGNAFKFTPVKGRISVDVQFEREFLEIKVSDTGVGIAKKDMATVFDKFTQIDNNLDKDYKGTGLGLSIVKKILVKMKGDISFESIANKGTCFIVRIPIKEETA